MLFPSESEREEIARIHGESQAGTLDAVQAGERLLKINPESGLPYLLLGNARKRAGDSAEAESYLWKAIDRTPCDYPVYIALAEVRSDVDPEDAMAACLRTLAMWKLSFKDQIPHDVVETFRRKSPRLDAEDPETYRAVAMTLEKGLDSPPEVSDRLLPHRLLNRLQDQAEDAVSSELVEQIRDDAARCLPVWRAALREWGRNPRALSAKALALIIAWLGEIGEGDVLDDLLELACFDDDVLFLHVQWAIWRVGQRFPAEALAKFRSVTPSAPVELRCVLADQLNLLPEVDGLAPALTALLDGFPDFAAEDDAPYLLLAVADALGELSHEEEADHLFHRYRGVLPAGGRQKLRDLIDPKAGFIPKLVELEIDGPSIEDVCMGRIFMEDEYDDDDSAAGQSPIPQAPRVKPDRNGPCWCGSGKKYKKCHLAQDEETARAHHHDEGGQPRPDPFYHSLLGKLLGSVPQVCSRAEMREAHRLYFDSGSMEGEFGKPGSERFTEWFVFDFRPGGSGRTVVEEYIRRRPRLPERELALLESWRASRFALLEVQRVQPGDGVEVKDVFAGDQFFIHDVTASRSGSRWDCILTRVQEFEGRWIFTGSGLSVSRSILPLFLSRIEAECGAAGVPAAAYVRANSHRLHRVLMESHKQQLDGLQIVNPEGDELEFSSAEYQAGDVESLAAALTGTEVFEESTSKGEAPGVRTFGWLEVGADGPRRSYGHIEIRDGRLRLECNSRRRLAIGRQLIEKNAGAFLKHERDAFTSVAEIKDKVLREGSSKQPAKTGSAPSEVENRRLLQFKTEHYATWPDEKLPALEGQTPREAVRSEVGKRAVEDLIRQMENGEDRLRLEGGAAFDFEPIRKILGL